MFASRKNGALLYGTNRFAEAEPLMRPLAGMNIRPREAGEDEGGAGGGSRRK
jgi:hypothetical protein